MTTITIIAISIAVIGSVLLGRCGYISNRRAEKIKKLKVKIKKLAHRLDYIADSSTYDRRYEIEEDDLAEVYNVFMKVYVRVDWVGGQDIDTCCYCLIKQFHFADDKELAKNEAEELLDMLNRS